MRDDDEEEEMREDEEEEGKYQVNLVMELVVGAEHDESAPGYAQGEEHLARSVPPHIDVEHLLPLGDKKELESLHRPGQRHAAHKQGNENKVGEGGGEVDHLSTGLDPLHEAEEDHYPGEGEGQGQLVAPAPQVAEGALHPRAVAAQAGGDAEHVLLPELLRAALVQVAGALQPSLTPVRSVGQVPGAAPVQPQGSVD